MEVWQTYSWSDMKVTRLTRPSSWGAFCGTEVRALPDLGVVASLSWLRLSVLHTGRSSTNGESELRVWHCCCFWAGKRTPECRALKC